MQHLWIFIILVFHLLTVPFTAFGQANSLEKASNWKGFQKIEFEFQGRNAWIVQPPNALPGNPWIWRAHFPTWHTEMDSILVSRGFHIAYINTNDLFGHPKALLAWDEFYNFLTEQKKFSQKVALEAVSRGGLYAYGWAKRNPAKVSVIYAEAPVCDPKSWPGGLGKGLGSADDWKKWQHIFGITEEQAHSFTDIPLEGLEGLAAYKVPLIHVISLEDKYVPNDENTFPLIQKYMKLGGPATVYTMTRGAQALEGHHFKIEDPSLFADLIQLHSTPGPTLIASSKYRDINKGLSQSFERFKKTNKGTVAFLGGSITHNPGWRPKTAQYLSELFPKTEFKFIAAGIPSLGSTPHAFRFQQDVIAHGTPDLLFIESAVNDRTNGFSETAQFRALEGIVQQALKANPSVDIIFMAFADPDKNRDYDQNITPTEVSVHQRVAAAYGFPFINLAQEVYDRIKAGEFSWEYDFKDLHPSPFGQEVYFQSIKELLSKADIGVKTTNNKQLMNDPFSYSRGRYMAITDAQIKSGFTIDPSWEPKDKVGTRQGFTKVPMLVTEKEGSELEIKFNGRGIGLAVVSGPDAGVLEYSIDGKKYPPLDLYSQWSHVLHLPWYLMFDDNLKSGKHTLKVRVSTSKNKNSKGNAARIVHFLVNE